MLEINKIHQGNSAELLKQVNDNSVDLTVTSPPYDNLRDYKGYSFDFETIAKELYRVTREGGIIVWVIGDATINGSETGTSFKQVLYFKECGFNLHDTMIYHKKTPPLTHNRYEQEFEYMFILSKGKPKTFNPILIQKKYMDKRKNKAFSRNKDNSHDLGFSSKKTHKIKGNVWLFNVGGGKSTKDKFAFEHPAIFPEELAKDHILSWSNQGDLVLDCFAGSGTTLKIAKILKRDFIGIELEKSYCDISKKRLSQNTLLSLDTKQEGGNGIPPTNENV